MPLKSRPSSKSRSTWTAAVAGLLVLALHVLAGPAAAQSSVQGVAPVELPPGKGKDEVESYCSACHSLRLVVQQGLTRAGWAELIEWMVEEQGMPELDPADQKLVLDYLAEHIGPESGKTAQ